MQDASSSVGLDRDGQQGCRVALMRAAAYLALSSLVACAGLTRRAPPPDLKPWPEIRPDFRVETLRARMHEYSITFAAEVQQVREFGGSIAVSSQAGAEFERRFVDPWLADHPLPDITFVRVRPRQPRESTREADDLVSNSWVITARQGTDSRGAAALDFT